MSGVSLPLLLGALRSLYPAVRLLSRPAELAAYESDALTSFRARPAAVALPVSREEVVQTVRLCHVHGVPFVARGSGTSLSGGSLPIEGGIVIALNWLVRILRIDQTSASRWSSPAGSTARSPSRPTRTACSTRPIPLA